MSIISVAVGKTKYQINCPEGDEDRIESLAAKLNERVNSLSLKIRNADEKTILMLCAVMLESELQECANKDGSSNSLEISKDNDNDGDIVLNIERMIEKVEKL
jgi:cell division protein ZapA (FtsZ GTPase activity inhibitor)